MKFTSIEELLAHYNRRRSKYQLPKEQIEISDHTYKLVSGDELKLKDFVEGKCPETHDYDVVYKCSETGSEIIFKWHTVNFDLQFDGVEYHPSEKQQDVVAAEEEEEQITKDIENKSDSTDDRIVLSDSEEVTFVDFPSEPTVIGKIDTGATLSSLHVIDYDLNPEDDEKNSLTFTTDIFGEEKKYFVPPSLVTQVAVATADGGVEYRPGIITDIVIKEKKVTNVVFTLNDRSQMEYKVLIGQEVLEKGEFIVDPTIDVDVVDKRETIRPVDEK